MLQLCGVLFLCGLLKLSGLLNIFSSPYLVMAGHAAIVWCAIFVRFAQIERFAKYFFSPPNFSNGRTCYNYVVCDFCAVC